MRDTSTAALQRAYSNGLIQAVAKSDTVLVSDIDNTFICHEGHKNPLTDDSHMLAQVLGNRDFGAVLITGATWSQEANAAGGTPGVIQRMTAAESGDLSIIPPNVHAIFSSGGLDCHVRNEAGEFVPDTMYRSFIEAQKSNFSQGQVELSAADFIAEVKSEFGHLDLSPMESVEITFTPVQKVAVFQHEVKDGDGKRDGKISMYVHAEDEVQLARLNQLAEEYAEECGALCVVCEEKDINNRLNQLHHGSPPIKRYNIDFTAITKSTPIEYITQMLGKERGVALKVVVAGDAGNDSPMFNSPHATHGIIVGGAAKELQSQAAAFEQRGLEVYVESAHHKGPNSILCALEQFFPSNPFGAINLP